MIFLFQKKLRPSSDEIIVCFIMKQLKAVKLDLFDQANARLKPTGASRTGIAVSRKCKTDNWTDDHFFLGRSENRSVPVHPRPELIGFDRMTENQIWALHRKWKCSASDQSDKNWLIWSKCSVKNQGCHFFLSSLPLYCIRLFQEELQHLSTLHIKPEGMNQEWLPCTSKVFLLLRPRWMSSKKVAYLY